MFMFFCPIVTNGNDFQGYEFHLRFQESGQNSFVKYLYKLISINLTPCILIKVFIVILKYFIILNHPI